MNPQQVVILAMRQDDRRRTWIRLLSESQGVVEVMAYGTQRSKRRFAGGLSPTMWGRAWGKLRSGKIQLAGFEPDQAHLSLRHDPVAFASAAYACELASTLLASDAEDALLHPALQRCIRDLAAGAFAGGCLRAWELALLTHQGWVSPPGRCSHCDETQAELATYFEAQGGQWRCAQHCTSWSVDYLPGTVRVLAQIHHSWVTEQRPPTWISQGRYAQLEAPIRAQLRHWSWAWIDAHLPRPLKSRAVLLDMVAGSQAKAATPNFKPE